MTDSSFHTPYVDGARKLPGPPALRVLSGPQPGTRIPINPTLVIGRLPECDYRISDPRVSRKHAVLTYERGYLLIEDQGSQNGTYVAQSRVSRASLRLGDIIRIGRERFQVCSLDDPPAVQLVDDPLLTPDVVKNFNPNPISRPSNMPLESWFREIGAAGDDSDAARLPWLRQQTRNYAVLFEVSQRIHQIMDPKDMQRSVLEFLVGVLRADRAALILVEDGPDRLRQECVVYGPHAHAAPVLTMSGTVAKKVIEGRCGVISNDTHLDAQFTEADSIIAGPSRSLLAVPLPAGARVLGLMELSCSVPGDTFGDAELELMQVVAAMLASALHRHELAEEAARRMDQLEQLRQQYAELQQGMERSAQLAHVGERMTKLLHEINNHLGPLRFAEVLREMYPDDKLLGEHVRMLEETATAIQRMLDDFRRTAEEPGATVMMAPGRLSDPARSAERFLRFDDAVKDHRLRIIVENTPMVSIDEQLIRAAVINLVRNAGQAIEHDHGEITIKVLQRGPRALLTVQDNGSGIPLHVQPRVFEPKFTTKGDGGGTGVGLAICRQTIEAHHGSLTFQTQPGRGTIFIIDLPILQMEPVLLRGPTISSENDSDDATGVFRRPLLMLDEDEDTRDRPTNIEE